MSVNPITDPTGTQDAMQKVMAMLQSLQSQKQGQAMPGPAQGQPQPTTAAYTGVAGTPPPLPFNTGGSGVPPQAAAPRPPEPGPPMPAGFQTGMVPGSQDAVIQGTVGGVVQAIHQVNEKKKAELAKKAENYMTQLSQAMQNGDQEMVNTMLSDPKIVKTIEKGLDYEFVKKPQAANQPQEPEPPEATGIKAALHKLAFGKPKAPQPTSLPMPGQPGGIMLPKPGPSQQLANVTANAQLEAAKTDPEYLRQLATGTGLTGAENRQAEAMAKNLQISPKEVAILNAQQQNAIMKVYGTIAVERMKAEASLAHATEMSRGRVEAAGVAGQYKLNSAKLMADARKYAADTTKLGFKIQQGKADLQLPLAMVKFYDDQAKTYTQAAAKTTDDKSRKYYQSQAESYAKKAEGVKQELEDQDLLKQYGGFLSGEELPGGAAGGVGIPAEDDTDESDEEE